MAEFKLHCFAQSGNAYKVALMLALAKADWAPVYVDFFKVGGRDPGFLALNPMGEVPVLEHKGEVLSQSGAILDYLAAVLGEFDPGPENGREALRWILWDNHKLTSYLASWRFQINFAPQAAREPAVTAFLEGRARKALAILEAHLADRDWIACEWMSTADLSCAGYLFFEDEYPLDWSALPNIAAWKARLRRQEGWAHPYDLMPGHPLPGSG